MCDFNLIPHFFFDKIDAKTNDMSKMNVKPIKELAAILPQMKQWMEAMHQDPELSAQEVNTSKYVADLLKNMGYEVHEHVGKYGIEGVVGVLSHGDGKKKIGIRADMDALLFKRLTTCHTKVGTTAFLISADMMVIVPWHLGQLSIWQTQSTSMEPFTSIFSLPKRPCKAVLR